MEVPSRRSEVQLRGCGSALDTNVHFHTLVAEGVFATAPDGAVRFVPSPRPPTDGEVGRLLAAVRRRIGRLVRRHGLALDVDQADGGIADGLALAEPALAAIAGASVIGRVATGPRAGHQVVRLGADVTAPTVSRAGPRHAHREGFDLHAATAVRGGDWSMAPEGGPRFENLVGSHLLKYCHFIEDTEGYRMELRFLRDTPWRPSLRNRRRDGSALPEVLPRVEPAMNCPSCRHENPTGANRMFEGWVRAELAKALLGRGDLDRAEHEARTAVTVAHAQHSRRHELRGNLALAHSQFRRADAAALARAEQALVRAQELIDETDAQAFQPEVHECRAHLARLRGDSLAARREIEAARRLYAEMSASAQVERLAGEHDRW